MAKLSHLTSFLFVASCLSAACVEPADSGEDVAQQDDKDGGGHMSLRDVELVKSFTCSEWINCDLDIRAQRCAAGAPTGRVLGTLTLTDEAGDEVVAAEVKDTRYSWLIGTDQPGAYAYRISTLGRTERFTLSWKPEPTPPAAPPPPAGSHEPPAPPIEPACAELSIQWY